jgi:hypothetical protein
LAVTGYLTDTVSILLGKDCHVGIGAANAGGASTCCWAGSFSSSQGMP